jgi:flagellar motor protein MotB
MEDRATLKRSLEQSERLLTESRGHLQELDAKVQAAKNVSPEIQQRIERLSQSLSTQFARLARAKMLNISSARDRVSIAAAVPALFAPRSAEVTAEGRDLLCQLSKAIMAEYGGELRVTGYYGQPRVEDRELAGLQITPWARSATRAASAADVLQNGCGAPTERLLVVAYGPRAAGPLGENVALEFIFRPVD